MLGVSRTASPDQLRAAYVRLVKRCHPDHGARAQPPQWFGLVQQAYHCLRDPACRLAYDERLALQERALSSRTRRVRRRLRRFDARRAPSLTRAGFTQRRRAAWSCAGSALLIACLWELLAR